MRGRGLFAGLFLALALCACRHEIGLLPRQHEVVEPGERDGSPDGGEDGGMRTPPDGDDASSPDDLPDAGPDATVEPDGGDPFPYRWVENTPEMEGFSVIALDCVRDGEPVTCPMLCWLDGDDRGTCGKELRAFVHSGEHKLCIEVFAPPEDSVFAGQSRTQCVRFTPRDVEHPFRWVEVRPSSKSTSFSLPLKCRQDPPLSADDEPSEDCNFRCSLDGSPLHYCSGTFDRSGLVRGEHELRVETSAPVDHPLEHVQRTSVLRFEIDSDAEPAVERPVVTLPPLLDDQGLGVFASLLTPYVDFAKECSRASTVDGTVYRDAMRLFLSYGVQRATMQADADHVMQCVNALRDAPATCRYLQGMSESDLRELMLPVRLPYDCEQLFVGEGDPGAPCVTHADCKGLCERKDDWYESDLTFGACGSEHLAEEGTMCLTRGCEFGLYCAGVCKRANEVGEVCSRAHHGADCEHGYTCSTSAPHVCVPAQGKRGDSCSYSHSCQSGECDMVELRCR